MMRPINSPCRIVTIVFVAALAASAGNAAEGARLVRENGYDRCIELSNREARVVIEPNLGGRVLRYQLKGAEALFQDPAQDGVTYEPGRHVEPSAGRFDIGPETTLPRHPTLYLGQWTGEIIGDRAARLTSQRDSTLDLVLTREFKLAAQGSHLVCTQSIRNVGRESRRVFHWSRTLAAPNGICFVPLNSRSRYPQGYAVYLPGRSPGQVGAAIDFRPAAEPNIRVREGLLEFLGPPANPKYAIDPNAGWMAYLTRNHLLFVKKFPVYPDRVYGEIAANSVCIYYHPRFCELEPIGPVENLAPGQSASFTEEWWLHEFAFPEDKQTDLAELRSRVEASVARATDSPEQARRK